MRDCYVSPRVGSQGLTQKIKRTTARGGSSNTGGNIKIGFKIIIIIFICIKHVVEIKRKICIFDTLK